MNPQWGSLLFVSLPLSGVPAVTSQMVSDTTAADVVVGSLVKGIKWVRTKYTLFKLWLASQLVQALDEGWKAALTIVALVTVSIVVGFVWQIAMANATFVAVAAAIESIAETIAGLAAALHLDLVITLVTLAVLVNSKVAEQLAPLYDQLGSFAEELGLDMGYIVTFLEVDRAILTATYAFAPFQLIEANATYIKGLIEWLKTLKDRMRAYAENPQLIFTDLQASIIAGRIDPAAEESARVWAAIDLAGEWINAKGEVLITLVNDIESQVANMPTDIQWAIKPWYDDAIAQIRAFETDTWKPFWKEYKTYTDFIDDAFLDYDLDIEAMQRRMDDPLDWLRSLLGLSESDQSTFILTLDEFFGKLFPIEPKATEGYPSVLAAGVVLAERKQAHILTDPLTRDGTPRLPLPPGVDSPVLMAPWYKEMT
jgi:hypothetical protein